MRGRHKVQALVLSRRNIGEADRLVTFFTRDHGLVKAVAKGVRKIPSRRGGHLEPYTMVLALLTLTRDRHYVGAVETLDHFLPLREHAARFVGARNIVSSVLGLFEEGQVEPELFDAVHHAWQLLPELDEDKAAMLEVAVLSFALEKAGLMPDLSRCRQCQVISPTESIILDAGSGGWRCLTCHEGFTGTRYSLAPALLKVLRFIRAYPGEALKLQIDEMAVSQLVAAARQYVAQVTHQPIISSTYA